MGDYQLSRNSPSFYPLARILSKVDLGLAAYGVTLVGVLLTFLWVSPESLRNYALENPEQEDIVNFLELPEIEQFTILGLYLGWYIYELIIAIIFFFAAKNKSFGLLKIWMIITIINSLFTLLCTVPVYMFTTNKQGFTILAIVVYVYKLYSIYIVDFFTKETVARKAAALAAALAASIVYV